MSAANVWRMLSHFIHKYKNSVHRTLKNHHWNQLFEHMMMIIQIVINIFLKAPRPIRGGRLSPCARFTVANLINEDLAVNVVINVLWAHRSSWTPETPFILLPHRPCASLALNLKGMRGAAIHWPGRKISFVHCHNDAIACFQLRTSMKIPNERKLHPCAVTPCFALDLLWPQK